MNTASHEVNIQSCKQNYACTLRASTEARTSVTVIRSFKELFVKSACPRIIFEMSWLRRFAMLRYDLPWFDSVCSYFCCGYFFGYFDKSN